MPCALRLLHGVRHVPCIQEAMTSPIHMETLSELKWSRRTVAMKPVSAIWRGLDMIYLGQAGILGLPTESASVSNKEISCTKGTVQLLLFHRVFEQNSVKYIMCQGRM